MSRNGRRLAAAYSKSFVIWDLTFGRPLTDPIACNSEVAGFEFLGNNSEQIAARLEDGTTLQWDYADSSVHLSDAQRETLTQLARTIASGDWAALAGDETPASNDGSIVNSLKEHFTAEANALPQIACAPASARISNEAVTALLLRSAKPPIEPSSIKMFADRLREVQQTAGVEGAKQVETAVQEWRRHGWRELEDQLVGKVWCWTTSNDSEESDGAEFAATLELRREDPLAIAAADFWDRRALGAAERPDAEESQREALPEIKRRLGAGWAGRADKHSEEALARTLSPENRLLRAQVLATPGKSKEALETLQNPAAGALRAEDRELEAALLLADKRADAAERLNTLVGLFQFFALSNFFLGPR